MEDITVIIVLAAALALVVAIWVLKPKFLQHRRRKLRQKNASLTMTTVLEQKVGLYSLLPDALKTELHGHMHVFLDEKRFRGCDGVEVTDEMCIIIAGLACMLLLNRPTTYFPGFSSILIYPQAYMATETRHEDGVAVQRQMLRAGESWHRGPIVLSWQDVQRGAAIAGDGYNVVLHEFAHKLDEENNGTNGQPVLGRQEHYSEWAEVLGREYAALEKRVERRKNRVLDEYGLTSPPEFFAVATESFFEKSRQMKKRLPDLYDQLQTFYRLDPASWHHKR